MSRLGTYRRRQAEPMQTAGALSVTLTAALRFPVAKGVKVALMLQLAYGGSDEGQLLAWPKSVLSAPIIAIE